MVGMQEPGSASRRTFIAGAAGLTLTSTATAKTSPSLKALGAEKGILFGSAVGAGKAGSLTGSFADTHYQALLKSECAILVPENELKIYVIAGTPGTYNFSPGDTIAAFARDNRMKLRGHTLFWNRVEFLPKWVLDYDFGPSPAKGAEAFLRNYIGRVCDHYGDHIYSWDVVNETIDPKTGLIRDTPYTKALGFDALRVAYETARAHAPKAQLVYNDYMSWEAGNETHRTGVLKLLERFRKENVPIDAFGIQSHIGNDGHIKAAQFKEWRQFVDEATAMGYRLLITEFDVNDKDLPTDPAIRDAEIAAAAKAYLDLMFDYKNLDQCLCWGMADKYSWLQEWTPRADKTPQRPTPYDDNYKPKPLRAAIAAALRAAPRR
jgi:endo-1,4-beta-xylanase